MRVLGLFSGIGGMELGLERAGMEIGAMCEIDPYCQQVLRKHWPEVTIYDDITTLTADALARDGIGVDAICGGFPCQQTSLAACIHGAREGLDGPDSGLWREYLRLVRALRPIWVIVENPPGIGTWAGAIAAGLEGAGYRVSRLQRSAHDHGAPHQRERVLFVADAMRERWFAGDWLGNASENAEIHPWPAPPRGTWRAPRSGNNRMDDGVSHWVERVTALGNAICPQKAEMIGRAIMAFEPGAR